MTNTHAEMVLDYSIDGTVVAAEFGKFDMMGSSLFCMELQSKARNSRDARMWFRTVTKAREGDGERREGVNTRCQH